MCVVTIFIIPSVPVQTLLRILPLPHTVFVLEALGRINCQNCLKIKVLSTDSRMVVLLSSCYSYIKPSFAQAFDHTWNIISLSTVMVAAGQRQAVVAINYSVIFVRIIYCSLSVKLTLNIYIVFHSNNSCIFLPGEPDSAQFRP